ncbi:hypothetical protein HHK36_022714 [Tetracentron sinense]|uniref:Pentatricopeptide repeat-containing protein n=1 Tax=Tetracentron sinense TaxID=13715 RepID=A0A835D941_TETSI|nr:hypothetical protein HHK36_022714 [Tetracentron sinense]
MGLDRSTSLLFKLINSSCALLSSLEYALSVFNQILEPETHLCNWVLRELSGSFKPEKTLLVSRKMRRREGIGIDRFSFLPLLKASARVSALDEGMEIHGLASNLGFDSDSGLYDDVLLLFEEMKSSNVEPDVMVLATKLSACGRAENLNSWKATHEYISKKNFKVDPHLQSALITMYSSCGSMDSAQRLFDNMSPKNLVASTAMVCEYSKLGMIKAARSIFDQMVGKGLDFLECNDFWLC